MAADPAGIGWSGTKLGPDEGRLVWLGGIGVRFLLDGARTGGGFSLVEHPIAPKTLAAPMHVHHAEDEYSFILSGQVGLQLGDEVVLAGPGDLVVKPREVPHAFWNPGDTEARMLELIAPAGFEQFFAQLPAQFDERGEPTDPEALEALSRRYQLDMDWDSVPELMRRHGLERA